MLHTDHIIEGNLEIQLFSLYLVCTRVEGQGFKLKSRMRYEIQLLDWSVENMTTGTDMALNMMS
jgi:hypothetical protein